MFLFPIELIPLKIKEAVVKRFQTICNERNMKYNELANLAGVTPSTVYSMMDSSRHDLSIITIKKLCDGLDMTLSDFFDDSIFENVEQEIS